jgi:hypothetical protein
MSNVLRMPHRTFKAKLFEVSCEDASFKVAGTLDGFIDLATPNGTYVLSLEEVRALISALNSTITDVQSNCLYDADSRLMP